MALRCNLMLSQEWFRKAFTGQILFIYNFRQAVTKDLTSSSNFSGSFVLTLQTHPLLEISCLWEVLHLIRGRYLHFNKNPFVSFILYHQKFFKAFIRELRYLSVGVLCYETKRKLSQEYKANHEFFIGLQSFVLSLMASSFRLEVHNSFMKRSSWNLVWNLSTPLILSSSNRILLEIINDDRLSILCCNYLSNLFTGRLLSVSN